jgi:hypothetical protein
MPFATGAKRFRVALAQKSLFDAAEDETLVFCSLRCTYEAGAAQGRERAKKDRRARR